MRAAWANYGPENGHFNSPQGLTVSRGQLYVADTRIIVFGLPNCGLPFLDLLPD